MCLETAAFFAKRRVAKEDITVWKFMLSKRIETSNLLLFAYYRFGFQYKLGRTYEGELDTPRKWKGFFHTGSINKGFHSLSSYREALHASKKDNVEDAVVVRCTIPKGSEYYVGNWEGYKGYASTSIRIDEVVPHELVVPAKGTHLGGQKWAI